MKKKIRIELREDGNLDPEDVKYMIVEPIKALSMASTGGELTADDENALSWLLREKIQDLDRHLGKLIDGNSGKK